jgi:phage tail-like protein
MAIFQTRLDQDVRNLGLRWRKDELVNIHYNLEVEGLLAGYFLWMTGGDMEIGLINHDVTYETGDSTTLRIPGPTTFKPITLGKGFGDYHILYNWFAAASSGNINNARRNGSITLHSAAPGQYGPVARWDFSGGWCQYLSPFSYNQFQGSLTVQVKITLQVESLEMVAP